MDYASLNQANSLTFAPDDPLTLWGGTAAGGGRWVCGMAFDGHGNPWLATCDGYHTYGVGLVHREGPQAAWSAVTTEEGLLSHSLLCVAVAPDASDTQPSLAVGTMQGISVYQDGAWLALLVD